MPNLPRLRRGARGTVTTRPPEQPETPNVEIIEANGLRWINIERPRAVDRAWLEEHFDFHPLDYEDLFSRNQRPKVDEYDDYLFVVLQFPKYDARVKRLNAAELDVFVERDYEAREALFSKGAGFLLYRIVDNAVDASFPMLRKISNKLEDLEEDIF